VAEKKVISNMATAGVYYFRRGADFVQYAEQMINNNITTFEENFICPIYNEYIKNGEKIRNFPVDKVWSFSTPKDVDYFIQKYNGAFNQG
jgi:dTDP-glucose pyrophosphorylase